MTSHFIFLQAEWPAVHEAATKAEASAFSDPRTSCFHARRALELAVAWLYKHDASLKLPYQDNLSALIHEPTFKAAVGEAIFNKAKVLTRLGNQAVHSAKPIYQLDSLAAVRELFHVGYWLAHTYARGEKPAAGLAFDQEALPRDGQVLKQTADQLRKLQEDLQAKDEKLSVLLADKTALDEELARLRAEVAEAKKANAAAPDPHDYSEAATRDLFIDLLLREAGWALDNSGGERDREFEVAGMPNAGGVGFVDYVLWGDDGRPLALVEAKRTKRSPKEGEQQAKLYADCLEARFGRRPVIFLTNGYDHWLWDDASHPPRAVQGFYKKAELELLHQRRTTRKSLAAAKVDEAIVGRYYQTRSIRRIGEAFEKDNDRKALVVMATGAGKTRTVIALADLLMRCNWAKRVLFLADRVALVNQAVNAFKRHLPDASPVNLVTEKDAEGRVFVSTYPTMMGLINESGESRDGQRRFGVGHFDLVIIDEAHRSVFQKYRVIFDYFDSLLVGLTATPKDEVDRNTYDLFDLETGVPTDAYPLEDAVRDGFLVPPKAVSVPLKFQREGIKYAELSEDEKDQWDALEWDEEGGTPDRVEADAVNKWLFNQDTVDKVLAHVMTRGLKVAGGDRLGKTIVFAKNQAHAEFIQERFDVNYPKLKGHFARIITFKTEYAQSLIDDFSQKDKAPHIALSVDMLDTGIDVPEVANLVFFKLVRSKTKFWQMLGRGTRLCPDHFGQGEDKDVFYVFDYCQNLEFFSQNPETTDGSLGESLGKRIFKARLELIGALDERAAKGEGSAAAGAEDAAVRGETAETLRAIVAAMNPDNFVVRPKRRLVETYANPEAWAALGAEKHRELARDVAGLPSETEPENEEAKRFDLLVLGTQLAVLRKEPAFERLRDQAKAIAALLEEKSTIPMVREQLPLIEDVQTDEWWQDVTVPMLEVMRKRLRDLVKLIDKKKRKVVYTDFEDEMGGESIVALPGFDGAASYGKFRAKARAFLRAHADHIAVHRLRMNVPLTPTDLAELERMLAESGAGSAEDIERAKAEAKGLGLFVRSLVGLDREAAKKALGSFVGVKGASQIEFVNLIVEHLTEHGTIPASRLYESPFTDVAPQGPDALFSSSEVDRLVEILHEVEATAAVVG
ncbi:MAG: DEAD/DEAH box helicase family protein [Deltaproteobacteria bacterium]|nr:DEAD/DEAH box helicase family protein [Deltaproteobacteria bacterium]